MYPCLYFLTLIDVYVYRLQNTFIYLFFTREVELKFSLKLVQENNVFYYSKAGFQHFEHEHLL
jgi:hypothetical protein